MFSSPTLEKLENAVCIHHLMNTNGDRKVRSGGILGVLEGIGLSYRIWRGGLSEERNMQPWGSR